MITAKEEYANSNYLKYKDKKANKGEKKFKKAMSKLGMKPVPGITRVTIKKAKSVKR